MKRRQGGTIGIIAFRRNIYDSKEFLKTFRNKVGTFFIDPLLAMGCIIYIT